MIHNLETSVSSFVKRLHSHTGNYFNETHSIRFAEGKLIKELKELEEKAKNNPTQELMAIIEKKKQILQQMNEILQKAKELSFAPIRFELDKARIWTSQNTMTA